MSQPINELDPFVPPRKGIVAWSVPKLYIVLCLGLICTVFFNVLLLSGAARIYRGDGLPIGSIMMWLSPLCVIFALWLTKWVRGLIDGAERF